MKRQALAPLLSALALAQGCSDTVSSQSPDGTPAWPDVPRVDAPSGDAPDSGPCPSFRALCDGRCVDPATDQDHCGACGTACGSTHYCRSGRCLARCTLPERSCSGEDDREVCVNVLSDPQHCGACRNACGARETCEYARCVPVCPDGQSACGTVCRNLLTDSAHCGACDAACPSGRSCVGGNCETTCPPGQARCSGGCAELATSALHCGACGQSCAPTQRCEGGRCVAAPCGPEDSPEGRCLGSAIVRCEAGTLTRQPCEPGSVCAPSSEGLPARCVAATGTFRLTGRVTFETRVATPTSVSSLRATPAPGVPLQLLDEGDVELAAGTTDERGEYALTYAAREGALVRLRAVTARSDGPYNFVVRDASGATHAFTTPTFPATEAGSRDLAVTEPTNAGALAVFDTVRRAFERLRPYLPERPALLYLAWERGRSFSTTASSFYNPGSNTIFVNGSSTDPDEFDPSVISHEFGHYFQRRYSRDTSPGGRHDGSPADPNLAFSEGFATFVSTLVTGSSYYIDAGPTRLRIVRDLATLPLIRNFQGDPTQGLDQPISEYLVAATQYTLFTTGSDRTRQTDRVMASMRTYLPRTPTPDRGEPGVDLVDFLDGYLCVNDEADRDTIDRYVVRERRFPYDHAFRTLCR